MLLKYLFPVHWYVFAKIISQLCILKEVRKQQTLNTLKTLKRGCNKIFGFYALEHAVPALLSARTENNA